MEIYNQTTYDVFQIVEGIVVSRINYWELETDSDLMREHSRIAGLDAARSSMMILGVLLHSLIFSIYFAHVESLVEAQTIFGVFFTIHTFRMPAFFFLAGFFASLLISKRGPNGYLKNRMKRIGAVLLLLSPIISPLTVWASGESIPFNGLKDWNLRHLWFLYYLLIISGVTYVFSTVPVPGKIIKAKIRIGLWLSDPRLLWIAPLLLLPIPGILDESARIRTSENVIPDLALLIFYGLFFILGMFFHESGKAGLEALSRRSIVLFFIGLTSAQISFGWGMNSTTSRIHFFLSLTASFYLSFGVIGIFTRLVNKENRVWTYLTRTSYWVYLVHLPIVYLLLRFFSSYGMFGLRLTVITFLTSLSLSILSFEVLVRRTPLAKLV